MTVRVLFFSVLRDIAGTDETPMTLAAPATVATLLEDCFTRWPKLRNWDASLLIAVDQNEGVSQTALVKMTGIDRSTLADLVARLLAQGYLQRRRTKDDGRTNSVRITSAGKRMLKLAQPGADEVDKQVLVAGKDEDSGIHTAALWLLVAIRPFLAKGRQKAWSCTPAWWHAVTSDRYKPWGGNHRPRGCTERLTREAQISR